jgi:hypothetical protein
MKLLLKYKRKFGESQEEAQTGGKIFLNKNPAARRCRGQEQRLPASRFLAAGWLWREEEVA